MAAETTRRAPALVILAAGASTRLGQNKALAEIHGEPAIAHLLRSGRSLGDPEPLVVTGADEGAIARALSNLDHEDTLFEVAHNAQWTRGRSSSLALARQLRPGCDLCLAPVDCPLVSPGVFEQLTRSWVEEGRPARGWLGPRLGSDPHSNHGHPVVLGRELLSDWDGSESPRSLRQRAQPLLSVPVADPAILDNLDRPADLARLRTRR